MWALDPMVRGPGASARVILALNQNRMGAICFGMHKLLNQFRISIWVPRLRFEMRLTAFIAPCVREEHIRDAFVEHAEAAADHELIETRRIIGKA